MIQKNLNVKDPYYVIKFIKHIYKLNKAYYFKFKDENNCFLILKNSDHLKKTIHCYV